MAGKIHASALCVFLVLCSVLSAGALHCMFMGYPDVEYDGKDRTEVLTERNFNKTVFADGAHSVVFFNDVEADDDEYDQFECFLQLSAQTLEDDGYKFYTVNTTKEQRLRDQEEVEKGEDTILVFEDGYQIEYNGIRDPETFVGWVMDIPDDPVSIIDDKDDYEDFEDDEDDIVRVVGYFKPNSKAFKEFEEAAEEFMGEIEFFAVTDEKWAKKMDLDEIGDVHLYRPFEDDPIEAPDNVDTEEEFEDWVRDNMEPIMQQLTRENYFAVWDDPDDDERMIVVFADDEEPEGKAVKKLMEEVVNDHPEWSGTVEIVLIDPDDFPLMVDIWEDMFDVDIDEGPQIGLVDIEDEDAEWFDMDQLNLEEAKKYRDVNEEVIEKWIEQILDGEISLDGRKRYSRDRNFKNVSKKLTQRIHDSQYSKRRKTKRVKVKKEKKDENQQGHNANLHPNSKDEPSSNNETIGTFHVDAWTELCEFEYQILVQKIRVLEAKVGELTVALDKLSKRQDANLENENFAKPLRIRTGRKGPPVLPNYLDTKNNTPHLSSNKLSPKMVHDPNFIDNDIGHGFFRKKNRYQVRSIRRCRRNRLDECNVIEYYTTKNRVIMYLVCAFLICMLRAMRITMSFYVCPVIDDWRDFLRRKLPGNIRQWMWAYNVRF